METDAVNERTAVSTADELSDAVTQAVKDYCSDGIDALERCVYAHMPASKESLESMTRGLDELHRKLQDHADLQLAALRTFIHASCFAHPPQTVAVRQPTAQSGSLEHAKTSPAPSPDGQSDAPAVPHAADATAHACPDAAAAEQAGLLEELAQLRQQLRSVSASNTALRQQLQLVEDALSPDGAGLSQQLSKTIRACCTRPGGVREDLASMAHGSRQLLQLTRRAQQLHGSLQAPCLFPACSPGSPTPPDGGLPRTPPSGKSLRRMSLGESALGAADEERQALNSAQALQSRWGCLSRDALTALHTALT